MYDLWEKDAIWYKILKKMASAKEWGKYTSQVSLLLNYYLKQDSLYTLFYNDQEKNYGRFVVFNF